MSTVGGAAFLLLAALTKLRSLSTGLSTSDSVPANFTVRHVHQCDTSFQAMSERR